jgi:UDP-N-acetylmuramoylalanine--D-glutamate ligase
MARSHLVVGAGMAAVASAEALLRDGDGVTITDRRPSDALERLSAAGATIVIADPPPIELLDEVDDLVVSPGVPPHDALAAAAVSAGLDVYSEPELAWRRRVPGAPPWLAVTGTNGKSTTVTMLAAILRASGSRTAALGNIGEPLVTSAATTGAGADGEAEFDVVAVELSSFQLHWSSTLAPEVGAFLNAADDHLEWHGTFEAYVAAKFEIWRSATVEAGGIAIGNLDDPLVATGLATVTGRAVGFTVGAPKPGQLGVVDGMLVDRVDWSDGDADVSVPLIEASAIRPTGAHNVSNALAAAAMARAYGVGPEAVRAGLAGYRPEPHRNATVATIAGITYVDDSKATNPHAAAASLAAYPSIVWIAGGQLKGVDVDDLVVSVADRLRGAVVLGVDRAEVIAALARHAPDVPVVDVPTTDDRAMGEVVVAAAGLAWPGDTVLLAPAAASKDMYASFGARGDAFAAAVHALDPAG